MKNKIYEQKNMNSKNIIDRLLEKREIPLIQIKIRNNSIDEKINLIKSLDADIFSIDISSIEDLENCENILKNIDSPIQITSIGENNKSLIEEAISIGVSSIQGGGISYTVPFTKNIPLTDSLSEWEYIDALIGLYDKNGFSINRESFAPLTGTLVPPSISNSIVILESLLALEKGVKNISLGYGQCGNLIQDIAGIKSLKKIAFEYFKKFKYKNFFASTVLYEWLGGLPENKEQRIALVSTGAIVASFGNVDRIILKTSNDYSKSTYESTIETTKTLLNFYKNQNFSSLELEKETEIITQETKSILDNIIGKSGGDLKSDIILAFEKGILDIPFAPSIYNKGKMMPARDSEGMVRYLTFGEIPLTEELKKYNLDKLKIRAQKEKIELNYQMTVQDISKFGQGSI